MKHFWRFCSQCHRAAQHCRNFEGNSQGGLSLRQVIIFHLLVINGKTPKDNNSIWGNFSRRCANWMPGLCCCLQEELPQTQEERGWSKRRLELSTSQFYKLQHVAQTSPKMLSENCPATAPSPWEGYFKSLNVVFQFIFYPQNKVKIQSKAPTTSPDKMSAIELWWPKNRYQSTSKMILLSFSPSETPH